jgi:hypothetical protein
MLANETAVVYSVATIGITARDALQPTTAKAFTEEGSVTSQSTPMRSGVVYRGGSATPTNLTPRPGDTTGLSTFDNLEAAVQPGGKAQMIDVSRLKSPLQAVSDPPPPGHVSIAPSDPVLISEWAAARGTETVHPFTQNVMNAIIDVVRRPK